MRPADPDPVRELLRRRHRPRPDGDDLLAGVAAQGAGEPLRDPAGAEHTPAQVGAAIGSGRREAGKVLGKLTASLDLGHAPALVHRRDDGLGHGARGHAVTPGRERRRDAGQHGVDPRLQLDPVGVGEPRAASRRRSRCRAAARRPPHPRRLGQADRAGLADDLAADVVAVAGVEERLAGAQHAVRGAQVDHLRVLQALVDLRRAARRRPRHLDHGRAQQPRHHVELVDRRAGDRELRRGVRGAADAPADVVHEHGCADGAVVDRLPQLHVAGVEAAHEPSDSSASPVAPMSRSTCRPSASVGASGFSHSTGLPARTAATTCSACTESCEAITTASTAGSRDQRERVVVGRAPLRPRRPARGRGRRPRRR